MANLALEPVAAAADAPERSAVELDDDALSMARRTTGWRGAGDVVLEAGEQTTPEALRHRLAHGRASKGPGRKILERGIEVPDAAPAKGA